ncbi:DNA polymerase subunit beta [Fibrobacterales bacterium]|nr:DNA polymerase subunit beta [Fibrobacterales bacterium]
MVQSTKKCLSLLREYASSHAVQYGIKRIGIFGSVARGEQNKDSDLDILLESDTISLFQMGTMLDDLEHLFDVPVDLIRKHKYLRPQFLERIEKDVVYA